MRPYIGVTSTADDDGRPTVRVRYLRAVQAAGGLPVALPFLTEEAEAVELLDQLDGMLFTGSDDLDSQLWDEPLHPDAVLMHPARASTEMLLARAVQMQRKPTLGICGGMQNLNVAFGGSLHQHIPDIAIGIQHKDPSFRERHPVEAEPGSLLEALLGRSFPVNTEHHQAVNRLASGFVATARAPDGIVEAFEDSSGSFLVGVQWHPELMLDDDGQRRIFGALVDAARGR